MRPTSPTRLGVPTLVFALCLALGAQAATWDPARATELATQLERELGAGLAAAREATPQETAIQQRTRDAAVAEMKRLHEFSREYASRMREDPSRDDSEPFFRQLLAAERHAWETAGDAVARNRVSPHLDRVAALLRELEALYERD